MTTRPVNPTGMNKSYASTANVSIKAIVKTRTMDQRQINQHQLHSRATLFDSLDTLYLVGLVDRFEQAVEDIHSLGGIPNSLLYPVSAFEYGIRVVGGLLGTFSLTRRPEFLRWAQEGADALIGSAFRASPSMFPYNSVRVCPRVASRLATCFAGDLLDIARRAIEPAVVRCSSLAAVGTYGLEFRFLSRETSDPTYANLVEKIESRVLELVELDKPEWMKRTGKTVDVVQGTWCGGTPGGHVALGSGADSFWEYMLKEQLLQDVDSKTSTTLFAALEREMLGNTLGLFHEREIRSHRDPAVRESVIFLSSSPKTRVHTHLGCFVGGLLALSALRKVQDDTKKHVDLATKLVQGCLWTYHPCLVFDECTEADLTSTAKGMLPVGCDAMQIPTQQDLDLGVEFNNGTPSSNFQLRPELVGSLFLLFRLTLDDRWRRSGWFIYKAMIIHCFVKDTGAFSSLGSASEITGEMPSFFLAETLKYLWLLFEDPNRFSLHDFVFSTEAHPLSTKRMCKPSCDDELLFLWWWDSTHTCLLSLVTIATCLFPFYCRRLDQMLYEPIDNKTRGKII